MTKHLVSRLCGDTIKSYLVSPGVVATDLSRYATNTWLKKFLHTHVWTRMIRTPEQGIESYLHVLNSDTKNLTNGAYYSTGSFKVVPVFEEKLTSLTEDGEINKIFLDSFENSSGQKIENYF